MESKINNLISELPKYIDLWHVSGELNNQDKIICLEYVSHIRMALYANHPYTFQFTKELANCFSNYIRANFKSSTKTDLLPILNKIIFECDFNIVR